MLCCLGLEVLMFMTLPVFFFLLEWIKKKMCGHFRCCFSFSIRFSVGGLLRSWSLIFMAMLIHYDGKCMKELKKFIFDLRIHDPRSEITIKKFKKLCIM